MFLKKMESMMLSLLLSFCGGVFGAAFGALTAFILFGFLLLLASVNSNEVLTNLALGELFGPHTAFAGGVAAAAFASHKKLLKESGKNLVTPLLFSGNISPLLIGGLFGSLGFLLQYLLFEFAEETLHILPSGTDVIAGSIVLSALIVRFLFSNTPLFNRKPFLFQEEAPGTKNGIWLPWETDWKLVIFLGIVFGTFFSFLALQIGNPLLGFGLSAMFLLFLHFGTHIPVTHHIALPAGTVAVLSGNLLCGIAFGLLGALLGEFSARIFYNGGKTHIDPPAFAIFVCSLFFFLF